MGTLIQFIKERRAQIHAEIAALQAELAQLDAAEKAARRAAAEASPFASGAVVPRVVVTRQGRRVTRGPTIKDFAVDVLHDQPHGATADRILQLIKEKHGQDFPRTSLSPQLSRLRREGRLDLHHGLWRIPPKAEGPNASTFEPSKLYQPELQDWSDPKSDPVKDDPSL